MNPGFTITENSRLGLRYAPALEGMCGLTPFVWPEREDAQGAEDPTVIAGADETVAYSSGWDQGNEPSTLLYARGSSVETLRKCGVAIARSATRANPKEATFARASEGASRIGVARSHGIDGPWKIEERAPFTIRADCWDDWHLSPGPIDQRRTWRSTDSLAPAKCALKDAYR